VTQAVDVGDACQTILDNLTLVQHGLRPGFYMDQPMWYGWDILKGLRQDLELRGLHATPLKHRTPHNLFVCLMNDIGADRVTDASFARTLHLYAQWLVRHGWMDPESIAMRHMTQWDFSPDWRWAHMLEHYSQAAPYALLIGPRASTEITLSSTELGTQLGYLQPHFYDVPRHQLGPCVAILFCTRARTEEMCIYQDRRCIQGEFVYGTRAEVEALRATYEARVETWRRVLEYPVRVGCIYYDRVAKTFEGVHGSASARQTIQRFLLQLIEEEEDGVEGEEEEEEEGEEEEEV